MVTTLLHLRFTVYRAPFNRHNSTKQLGILWSKLALQFNIVFDSNPKVSVDSLKNKIRALRSDYVKIKNAETATGNEVQPKKPDYFDEMLFAFSDMNGLGEIEFGRETHANESVSDEGTADIQQEIERQRGERKKQKVDIGAGLETLGKSLADGLVQAAKLTSYRDRHDDESDKGINMLVEVVQETKRSIEEANKVQVELLAFLKSKF
ncbi:hypothetical protein DYB25_010317 [Aphanomyces astaci]|uniref:Uncharacterized protein n=1 Tax=Aphanomyces astaci TaxID=112090 RepID=A0A397CWS4_APHAT|nr:hypothetical protein DYB25_010317 [Aphanomyces astaci]RHY51458.1 hypothetical protein DYB30_002178 [Aphanomyces astaci]